MKNGEVKDLSHNLSRLAKFSASRGIENFSYNKIIIRNTKILQQAIKEIDACVSKDLLALEEKMRFESEEAWNELSAEEVCIVNRYDFAKSKSSEKDRELHSELMISYEELMNEESDVKLYILEDESKIERVNLPLEYQYILNFFLKQD